MVRDEQGRIRKDMTFPCEILIEFDKEAPFIKVTKEHLKFRAYNKFNIKCKNRDGLLQTVVDIFTLSDMEFNVEISKNFYVRI